MATSAEQSLSNEHNHQLLQQQQLPAGVDDNDSLPAPLLSLDSIGDNLPPPLSYDDVPLPDCLPGDENVFPLPLPIPHDEDTLPLPVPSDDESKPEESDLLLVSVIPSNENDSNVPQPVFIPLADVIANEGLHPPPPSEFPTEHHFPSQTKAAEAEDELGDTSLSSLAEHETQVNLSVYLLLYIRSTVCLCALL